MTAQDQITKNIIEELGLNDLPQEKQEELVLKMTEVLLKRIFLNVMEKLSESDQDAYVKMIDEKSEPETMETFLQGKIKNYDEMVKEVIEQFKEEMKAV